MNKVELLAPAGSLEGFQGAVHAGADAVYIGGRKYGARAYAGFLPEEICLAIRYAHLYGRKVYLTVNTLVRESEMEELPDFIRPFYEEGLDGVIVQDMGVLSLVREAFPLLPLHASTQMNITGADGAEFLLAHGVSRVVPARELSLPELRAIKETGIEVEAFVHGAMCYCYSGQCLFSSMLGARSGNRGRCAQSCRLPYQVLDEQGKEKWPDGGCPPYPLSLKDMCTLSFLPEILQSGIDSLKIEGRMKKPEYTAGVTALYRQYIDRYYEKPAEEYRVSQEDRERLRRLYIRSEIQEGYYHRHNGRAMITPGKPGYLGADPAYLKEIRRNYIESAPAIDVDGEVILKKGKPAVCRFWKRENGQSGELLISREGQMVMTAQRQPLTEEAVKKQMTKCGNTPFAIRRLDVTMEANCFLPVRALNDLRRDTLGALERKMTDSGRRSSHREEDGGSKETATGTAPEQGGIPYSAIQFETWEQMEALYDSTFPDRLYVSGDFLSKESESRRSPQLEAWKQKKKGRELFLMMPRVVRRRGEPYLSALKKILFAGDTIWDGVLFHNVESLRFLEKNGYQKKKMADAGLYVWNQRARRFWQELGVGTTAPLECNSEDLGRLGLSGMEMVVYGRSPLMVTANCFYQTAGRCLRKERQGGAESGRLLLRDRYHTDFPVRAVCSHCYNEIYNSVPLSLHEYGRSVAAAAVAGIRLIFTTEGPAEIRQVLDCFRDFTTAPGRRRTVPFPCTKGHYKRGAE